MRKLQSKTVKNRKKKINNILLGIVMISILVFSTAGFALFSKDDATNEKEAQIINVNGYDFQKQNNVWLVQINNEFKAFFHLPTEIDNVSINITTEMLDLVNKPLYLVNAEQTKNQIDANLLPGYVLRTQNACTTGENCTGDYPTKDCTVSSVTIDNKTVNLETDNIIIYKDKNSTTSVYQENNCIYITGDSIKGTDKFLQKIFKII